jgi:hypothetical protein
MVTKKCEFFHTLFKLWCHFMLLQIFIPQKKQTTSSRGNVVEGLKGCYAKLHSSTINILGGMSNIL